ncbi:MAG TPA: helix-turn-helix transcriptional regulator [Streptosporangiaceae bacterium]|nr:helix-turn-helix transcriptional regulator [Streptosporangiaceae bacterium]
MTGTRPKLRALREERGWTQQEVADQLVRLAWVRQHEHVGVNSDMVAKWERGDKRPSPRYRQLLSVLFEADVHALGLGGAAPVEPSANGEADRNSLMEMLGGAASVFDELGRPGRSCSRGCLTCGRTRSCSVVPY